jgi:ribonuclease PH
MTTPRTPHSRSDRKSNQLRPVSIEVGTNRYAEGSAIIRCGNTHVLCTASVEESVPGWLAGKGKGWVSAEYAMLPRATHTRSKRDREKISGRTQEIQRLIGRALRTMVDFKALGERSIIIDCDVLQADGGTRTASITGGCVALAMALSNLKKAGKIENLPSGFPWLDTVAAVSVGIQGSENLVDLDYEEDSSCDADMNFVVTGKGLFVEVQGTAEREPFSMSQLQKVTETALGAVRELSQIQMAVISRFI